MPRPTDHPDGPSTLPAPELNPLLNPVLGENMGRWAEVYFTSPPEKREQAVLELLRKLQAEKPAREDDMVTSPSSVQEQPPEPGVAPASQIAEVQQKLVRCHACGQENPASHRFCGMCGKPVGEQGTAAGPHIADLHIADPHVEDMPIEDLPQDELAPAVQSNESQSVPSEDAVYEPALSTNELSLFQAGRRDDRTAGISDSAPTSGSYRVYVGIALAIVIFALAYIAWRSAQATSQSSHVALQAPPAVTTQPAAPAPTPPEASKPETPDRTLSPNEQAAVPSPADPASEQADAKTNGETTAQPAPPPTPTPEKNPQAETLAGNGAEELALAQRYLNGTNGQERNGAEAAKWLWKAVAKENADATLLLSDLYLKGDGVGKNCDQARVLLDAAARRGMKDAGERLRHLQAFGCE